MALDDEAVAGLVELATGGGGQQTAADQGLSKATGFRRQHGIPPIVSLWVGSAGKCRKIRYNR